MARSCLIFGDVEGKPDLLRECTIRLATKPLPGYRRKFRVAA